ncbi:MAG: hypothetical protein IKR97_04875, partial [Eubacterium sp.]|nr:hypothetical protein [Eubacterium sp.]
ILAAFAFMSLGSGSSSAASTETKAPANVETGGTEESKAPAKAEEGSPEETTSAEASAPQEDSSIEEQVILEEQGIKITAKGMDDSGLMGPGIKLLIENESGQDITVQTRDGSVNGYMIETMMSADVVNGKKANETLTFSSSDLKQAGISTFADMEFYFHIFDTSSWDTIFDSDRIQIKTSAADSYEYIFDDSGEVAYDNNGIKVVIKGLNEKDSIFGPGIVVYISNESDKAITVQTRDVSVNGFMLEPIFSSDVAAGKHALDSITFMSNQLTDNDIENIEDVELSFHIFDEKSFDTIEDTETIKITF